jgi:hypothetical protein
VPQRLDRNHNLVKAHPPARTKFGQVHYLDEDLGDDGGRQFGVPIGVALDGLPRRYLASGDDGRDVVQAQTARRAGRH